MYIKVDDLISNIIIIIIIIIWRNFVIHLEMSPMWIHCSWNMIIIKRLAAFRQNRIMDEKKKGKV